MARKKKSDEKTLEKKQNIANEKMKMDDVQKEINAELISEKKKKEIKFKNNSTYLFFTFFVKRLKEDKLYLMSFIITIVALAFFSVNKLQETEGYYDKKNETSTSESNVTPTVDTDLDTDEEEETTSDVLDISDYVGIYSREVAMSSPVVLSDTCSITSYKIVYQVKKDKTIIKYFVNDCVGTLKIWSSTLGYVSSGGARYISANNINYLFSSSSMKEVDGETYKIDDDISTIKESQKLENVSTYFFDSNVVFMTYTDLVMIKGNSIIYQLSDKIVNDGGSLEQLVYKSSTKYQFNFIVYSNHEDKSCYTTDEISDEEFEDGEIYKIYTIKYNSDTGNFDDPKEVVSRNKSAGCDVYQEDLDTLKE